MPRIPTVTSRVRASAAAPGSFLPTPRATAATFDVASPETGRALQTLGAGLRQAGLVAGEKARAERVQREEEELANAKAQADPTPMLISVRDAAKPDGSDLYENSRKALLGWISEEAAKITNDRVRSAFKRSMLNAAPATMSRIAEDADKLAKSHSRQQVGLSLSALENRVRVDPTAYDGAKGLGLDAMKPHAFLDTPAAHAAWTERLARAKFEGQIEQANTVAEVDAVRAEVRQEEWQKVMSPSDYDSTVDAIEARRSTLRKGSLTTARAAVGDLEKRTNNGNLIPQNELVAVNLAAVNSGDTQVASRVSRVARNQKMLTSYGAKGETNLRARAADARSGLAAVSGLPTEAAVAVDQGIMAGNGQVSGTYLVATAHMEYGAELAKEDTDYGVQSKTSTATGLYQFTEDTWLSVIRGEGDSLVQGAAEMPDAELLAMRSDPELSAKAASALAVRNGEFMESALSRNVTDFELYLGHFMGAPSAVGFITAHESDETRIARELMPEAAKANPSIFTPNGRDLTVGEVHDNLSASFYTVPGRAQYEDAAFLEDMANTAAKRTKENMMGYAREKGVAAVPPLTDADGPEARARAASIVSSTWRIPQTEIEPLEPNEVAHYKGILVGEDPDTKLEVMALFSQMGPTLAQNAYRQLGVEGNVYAHAAGLMHTGAPPAAAYDVVRGRTFLDKNPDFPKAMELFKQDVLDKYGADVAIAVGAMGHDAATGGAWQTVIDAAYSHYIQTYTRSGGKGIDDDAFTRSLNAVLGGTDTQPVLDEVNGESTVLPPGLTSDSVEEWMYYATEADWQNMSKRGLSPHYGDGSVIAPVDIQTQGAFEAVGAGEYRLKIDGQYATTGRTDAIGRPELFVFTLDADKMKQGIAAGLQDVQTGALTADEASWLRSKYGTMWAYDAESGQRLAEDEIAKRRAAATAAVEREQK